MKLVVGLGNPGKKYEKNRHNAGFWVIDALAKKFEAEDFQEEKKFQALVTKITIDDEIALLAKPLTFMNSSGETVRKIASFYKIQPKEVIVIYDDIDLPLGTIRIREKGGPGTHNGMKSIVEQLGTENFPRIRIGIESRGAVTPLSLDLTDFVLGNFSAKETAILKKVLDQASEALLAILTKGIRLAMETYNR